MSDVKRCTKCGEEKALCEFTPNKRASRGVNNWCKPCYRAYSSAYYAKTRDRRREQARGRRVANAEKCNAKGRAWREDNPDYYKRRYANDRERFKRMARERYRSDPRAHIRAAVEWARRNPEKTRARGAARHARKMNAPGGGVSAKEWAQIIVESFGLCAYCLEPTRPTMEHVEPLIRGGAHDPSNIVVACKRCNCSKRDQPLIVWMARRVAA